MLFIVAVWSNIRRLPTHSGNHNLWSHTLSLSQKTLQIISATSTQFILPNLLPRTGEINIPTCADKQYNPNARVAKQKPLDARN